jgi:hypothetical protein
VCGKTGRTTHLALQSEVHMVASLAGQVIDPALPRKKRIRVRFWVGRQLNHRTGELVAKDWRLDRRLDRYWEKIRDARGRFVHWLDHKLSNHRGHGSAKAKKP